jgi:hypothetical protein
MRHRRIPVIPGQPSPALTPLPAPAVRVIGKSQRWEVHYDPDDRSHVFVRNYRNRGWLSAAWTHLPMVGAPTADFTWRAARKIVAQRGADDTAIARPWPTRSPERETVLTGTRSSGAWPHATAPPPGQRCLRPTTPTRKRSKWRTTPAATYPVISFGAFEAGDERRYR